MRVICRYVPNNGLCDEKKIDRRQRDDAATYEYMSHCAKILSKPLVYLGDLNVCHMDNDMSATADFWFKEGFFQRSPDKIPKEKKDQGFCGTTFNERVRFKNLLQASRMYDPGAIISK
jgi:exonuclease III